MNLTDGLERYKQDSESWQLTLTVEQAARQILLYLSEFGDEPPPSALDACKDLLILIEKWKAMCLRDRMGNAEKNEKQAIWQAFRGAMDGRTDGDALLSVMRLKGFGSSIDQETGQRRAKVATSVLRFLRPIDWGVVDWRTIAILAQVERSKGDIDQAMIHAKKLNPKELRSLFDIIDHDAACDIYQQYRAMRSVPLLLPRAADVEMALFGLSMEAWPFVQ